MLVVKSEQKDNSCNRFLKILELVCGVQTSLWLILVKGRDLHDMLDSSCVPILYCRDNMKCQAMTQHRMLTKGS